MTEESKTRSKTGNFKTSQEWFKHFFNINRYNDLDGFRDIESDVPMGLDDFVYRFYRCSHRGREQLEPKSNVQEWKDVHKKLGWEYNY